MFGRKKKSLRPSEVFQPNRFPNHTFVDDHLVDRMRVLEQTIEAGSSLILISGPSKSGKTVFIEHAIGRDNLLAISGAGLASVDDIWRRVLDMIGTELPTGRSETKQHTDSFSGSGAGQLGVPGTSARASVTGGYSNSDTDSSSFAPLVDLLQTVIRDLSDSDLVIFLDDLHYVPSEVQKDFAQQAKEAMRHGVKFICATVPYRSDDVLRANPDLRGRIHSIDFEYWSDDVIAKIAEKGFSQLSLEVDHELINRLVQESSGSPQLMQYMCFNLCNESTIENIGEENHSITDDEEFFGRICRRTVDSVDYSSAVDTMREGPKVRGSDRTNHQTRFGWSGDVYEIVAKAISLDPPRLTLRYPELKERIDGCCTESQPSGSSITSACAQIAKLTNANAGATIIDWDGENDVLDIHDPYLLFFVRWSGMVNPRSSLRS